MSTLCRLLANVTYLGKVRHNGEVYPGQHKAIVDEAVTNHCSVRESARFLENLVVVQMAKDLIRPKVRIVLINLSSDYTSQRRGQLVAKHAKKHGGGD